MAFRLPRRGLTLLGLTLGAQTAHAYRAVGALRGSRYAAAPRGGLRAVQRTFFATAPVEEPPTQSSMVGYDLSIEAKWQTYWDEHRTFATRRREGKGKKYVLDMFPYPSGTGLHVGHPEGYTASDIMARYWRMNDYDVLHPMGWDSFGLPAEQHAMNTGTHPEVTTKINIANFKRQLKSVSASTGLPDANRALS